MPADKIVTQRYFAVQFPCRSHPHWGETPGHLIWCLPQVFVCHQLSTNCILSLQIQHDGQLCLLFPGLWSVGEGLLITLGMSGHLSMAAPIPCDLHNSIKALFCHQPKGLGDTEKFCRDITFLLVSTKKEAIGDRMYGLSSVWMNPYQARVSTVEEAVKELITLASSGPDWPYTLVQLNEDTCHVPLPKEGNLGILPEGGTNRTTCRMISQLEVCQLLQLDSQVIYPVGLNGHEIPLITTLPGSLANGRSLTGGKSVYLKVDILQSIVGKSDQNMLPPGKCPSILTVSPFKATPPKLERVVSMTMEVRELLSQAILDMSGHASGNSTPKRSNPVVVLTPPPHKLRYPSRLVDTSSQVSAPDDTEMVEASLEEIPTATSPTAETPGPHSGTHPTDASYLWEEANKALGELLATKLAGISFGAGHESLPKWFQNDRIHQGGQGHLHPFYPGSQDPLLYNHQGS